MPHDNKIQAPRGSKYPFNITVIDEDSISINGKRWFTRENYLEEVGLSATSSQMPYRHVASNRAECIEFFGMKLFRPITKGVRS